MKILMLGWEYPPLISGGLATACHGLVQGLKKEGHHITFVMPKAANDIETENFKLISASNVNLPSDTDAFRYPFNEIPLPFFPKIPGGEPHIFSGAYGPNLMEEVFWFAVVVARIAEEYQFDIIHAHDWLTYLAGIAAKKVMKKPLVAHIHATEFDRSPQINPVIYRIEELGFQMADKVIAVSNRTRNTVIEKYAIEPYMVVTTYNGVVRKEVSACSKHKLLDNRTVTFLGRITYQKGPDYFVEAARKVLKWKGNIHFIMAGTGDLLPGMIKKVASMGMASNFHFTGFLKNNEVERMLCQTNVFVMPSVSEPFGIAPLEAVNCRVPVIVSKQSGVAEVLDQALTIDYWDTDGMAEAIIGILDQRVLSMKMSRDGQLALRRLTWEKAASKVSEVYRAVG